MYRVLFAVLLFCCAASPLGEGQLRDTVRKAGVGLPQLPVLLVPLSFKPAPFEAVKVAANPGTAEQQLIRAIFGECGKPCVVTYSPGGKKLEFEMAADALVAEGIPLVIDGKCFSACAVAADRIRANTCVTPRASFYFHQGSSPDMQMVDGKLKEVGRKDYFNPPHSPAINQWVRARGGYPRYGWLVMGFEDAKEFWRVCQDEVMPISQSEKVPVPRPDPRRAKARRFSFI